MGSPWWNNNWRVDWLVGGLPWEESLHVVGDDEVWHGRRAGSAVVVCGGSRKKKGSSSFKLHKTTALAEKDLKSKAEAAKGKLGVAPAARPDAPKSAGELLLQGADYGDRYLVASMLACGVDANSTDKGGRTALMALQGRDPEIARMLLAAGASPHKALDACCMCSTVDAAETARVLAAAGATFAAPTESLKSAIYRGQIEIAEMILAAGEQVPKDLREQSREPGTQAFVIARGG
ncbi:MAG: ankyrin repeat domain-containing protein [Myxococcales bacterium]|nr:ankyrin repeat domain-containing protein [Myxococcales bacterium]